MGGGNQTDIGADKRIVSNPDATAVHKVQPVLINTRSPYPDILLKPGKKRQSQTQRLVDRRPGKAGKPFVHLVGGM